VASVSGVTFEPRTSHAQKHRSRTGLVFVRTVGDVVGGAVSREGPERRCRALVASVWGINEPLA